MRGFTFIELFITIALVSIAMSLTLIIGVDSVSRSVASGERDTVVTFLEVARTKALANVDEVPHGLHIDATHFTLFSGASFTAGASNNRSYERNAAVQVTGATDIVFNQLSGSVTMGTGTLTFTDGSHTATIDINSEGRIEW